MSISNKSLRSQIVRLQRSNVTNVFAVLAPFIKKSIELKAISTMMMFGAVPEETEENVCR